MKQDATESHWTPADRLRDGLAEAERILRRPRRTADDMHAQYAEAFGYLSQAVRFTLEWLDDSGVYTERDQSQKEG